MARRFKPVAFAVALAMCCVMLSAALLNLSAFRTLRSAEDGRMHTLIVLRHAEQLKTAVSAMRGGDDQAGRSEALLLETLRRETADNVRQQRNLDHVARELDAANLAMAPGAQSSFRLPHADKIDAGLDRVTEEENRLLVLRTQHALTASKNSTLSLVAMIGAILMGCVLIVFLALRRDAERKYELAERARLQDELARVAALLQGIIAATPGLIYAKGLDGRFLLANRPMLAFLGSAWQDVEGRTDADLLNNEKEGVAIMLNDRRIMQSGLAETIEELVSAPDGAPAVWLSTKAPLRNSDNEIIGMVGLSMDITDRKEAEAKLQTLQGELNQLARLGAMGELSLALAHELNQPLATIINHLAVAEHITLSGDDIDRSSLVKRLQQAGDQTMKAGDIVKRLRIFAESDKAEREIEPLPGLVAEAIAMIVGAAQRKNVTIDMRAQERDIRAHVNRAQIQQVVINLLQRAADALDLSGDVDRKIDVAVRKESDETAAIILTYDNAGLDQQQRRNIYQRFSTSSLDPTGIGLAISRRIIENHDGTLVFSSPDRGTRVVVSLPSR